MTQMSGNAYLSAWLEGDRAKLPVKKPGRCDHVEHICPDCIQSWSIDYNILLDRTNAGRRMAETLKVDEHISAEELRAELQRRRHAGLLPSPGQLVGKTS